MVRRWRVNWMVVTAAIVHVIWGLVLLVSDAPLHTTPLGHFPLRSGVIAGVSYIVAAVLAALPHSTWIQKHVGKYWRSMPDDLDTHYVGLLLTLPQQFLLMLSFYTAIISVINGAYPDGYVPDKYSDPQLFIFVDQLWPTVGMGCHTLSLLDWYWWSRRQ